MSPDPGASQARVSHRRSTIKNVTCGNRDRLHSCASSHCPVQYSCYTVTRQVPCGLARELYVRGFSLVSKGGSNRNQSFSMWIGVPMRGWYGNHYAPFSLLSKTISYNFTVLLLDWWKNLNPGQLNRAKFYFHHKASNLTGIKKKKINRNRKKSENVEHN